MKSNNKQKEAVNKGKGGNLGGSKKPEFQTPFHVFSKLVELESGRKASEILEEQGVEGVVKNLLSKVTFTEEQKMYFDFCFVDDIPEKEGAKRIGISLSRLEILKGEVFQALLKAHKSLGKEERTKAKQGKEDTDPWDSTYDNAIDFQAMEDWVHGEPDTPFTREVRKKLACAPSPYDELVRHELEEEEENRMKKVRATLAHLVRHADFTDLEKRCYELLYLEKVSDEEVVKRLGITPRHLTFLKKMIQEELVRVKEKFEKKKSSRKQIHGYGLTKEEREVWKLYFVDQLSLRQISKRLGIPNTTCQRIFKRVQKKRK